MTMNPRDQFIQRAAIEIVAMQLCHMSKGDGYIWDKCSEAAEVVRDTYRRRAITMIKESME